MKRNKVLLGLIVGLMTLAGGGADAQTGKKFYEVGPSNIGGEVSSLVLDINDTTRNTLYAGAATGGLFVRTTDTNLLRRLYTSLGADESRIARLAVDTTIWHHIPYFNPSGREVSLPISCMVQGSDGALYIGTGNVNRKYSSNYHALSSPGRGIYRFDPVACQFTMLVGSNSENFSSVNDLDYINRDGNFNLYAATPKGLFRWRVSSSGDWASQEPFEIYSDAVDEIKISRSTKVAYFSGHMRLCKIGDAAVGNTEISRRISDITNSNTAFANARRIRLAMAPTDPSYVYAMVIQRNGMMENLYLTTNGQTWQTITTSTVVPFSVNSGVSVGTIAVDPQNPKRVIIAGDNIWIGEGYVDGSLYQWTTASSHEHALMAFSGDYMSSAYGNRGFVHSGIHQIVPAYRIHRYTDSEGEPQSYDYHDYYIATNGGIFSTVYFGRYENISRGLNNVEINSIAVCPDGSIITGAHNNSSPIIEAHMAHVGGTPWLSWFDDGSLGNLNHDANVLFMAGSGGAVAASAFQRYRPSDEARRTIFTSSGNAQLGRTYADYLDYTNATTWTTGQGFMTSEIVDGPEIGFLSLWETDKNEFFNSTVKLVIDTLSYIFRKREGTDVYDTVWLALPGTTTAVRLQYNEEQMKWDTIPVGEGYGSSFKIKRGDKVILSSRAHADYPFEHTFTANQLAKDTVVAINPIQSRMVTIGTRAGQYGSPSDKCAVWYSWQPTDFTKVFDIDEFNSGDFGASANSPHEKLHFWSPILEINRAYPAYKNMFPRNAVISRDGLHVYVSAYDTLTKQSMLFRVSGFENADYTLPNYKVMQNFSVDAGSEQILQIDTFRVNGSTLFPRPISSLAVDPREGQDRLILTFDEISDNYANVAVIDNPSTNLTAITPMSIASYPSIPAYCALVEDSTGTIYVGTSNGVFTKQGNGTWQVYENIPDIPVPAMCQQTNKLPVRRTLTHTGITPNSNVFAKTKWPRAIYFGTFGRGVFMDMTYVTDTVNEVADSADYTPVGIPTVRNLGLNSVSLYPNPVFNQANIVVNSAVAGVAHLRVYDLNGRLVISRKLGQASEGENLYSFQTQGMSKGMYLVNVIIGGHTAATKMMVR